VAATQKQKTRLMAVFFRVSTGASIQARSNVFDQPKVMTLRKESHAKAIKPIMKVNGKFSNLNADIVFTSIKFMLAF
jgi:hypothetical protein